MLYLFLTDFVSSTIGVITFDAQSGPVSCESIGIVDDDDFEGMETFTATLLESQSPPPPSANDALIFSTDMATVTITDRNGKYTSCPASQLVRNTCNIGI